MDYGLLNALGISLMMIFGLWAYYNGYKKRHKNSDKRSKNIDSKDR